jgi:hypothetical protein
MQAQRDDMTDWLIHFTKDINVNDQVDVYVEVFNEESNEIEYELDYTNQFLPGISNYSAFDCIKKIINECGIRYGYSFRNGITTLYGGGPVICLTEMPLLSLIKYAKTRYKKAVSTYGIAVLKKDAFRFGARPVISGLSKGIDFSFIENTETRRIIQPAILPLNEQYRLVPLNLNDRNPIDWTHEREWRIKRKNDIKDVITVEYENQFAEIEVLNIFDNDNSFEEIILILNTSEEANEIFDMVLTLKDSGENNLGVSFNPNSISILVLENLQKREKPIKRIEDINKEDFFKVELPNLLEEEKLKLQKVIETAKTLVTQKAEVDFRANTKLRVDSNEDYVDSAGNSSIKCNDPRNKYLRGLIELGIAFPFGGGYIINAVGAHEFSQSITFNEFMAKRVCDYLNKELAEIFYTTSRLD